jgi:diguanylate cyclase (GGDEF)-like protein
VKLHGASLAALVAIGEELEVASGEWLWREGDGGDSAVVVLGGALEVLRESADGDAILIRTLGAGELVGELACLDGLARSASVRAQGPCRLLRVTADRFESLVRQQAELRDDLFWTQVERVRSLTTHVSRTHRRAITDSLTGLYNFGFFRERLALEVERARHTSDPVSLVLFDIDHFKRYNDVHGHQEGNVVLTRVAEIFRSAGRRGDIVARFGGEEFVLLLYGATRLDAWLLAESLRARIEAETFPGAATQPGGRLTVSAGVATFPEDAAGDNQLIEASDVRLYESKRSGRNRVSGKPPD